MKMLNMRNTPIYYSQIKSLCDTLLWRKKGKCTLISIKNNIIIKPLSLF